MPLRPALDGLDDPCSEIADLLAQTPPGRVMDSKFKGLSDIALKEANCTVCYKCSRECPDWCIYIDSHKETIPATTEGGRERQRNVLDRFAFAGNPQQIAAHVEAAFDAGAIRALAHPILRRGLYADMPGIERAQIHYEAARLLSARLPLRPSGPPPAATAG